MASVEGESTSCPNCSGQFLEKLPVEDPDTDSGFQDNAFNAGAVRSEVSTPSTLEEGEPGTEKSTKTAANRKKKQKKNKKKNDMATTLTENDLYEVPEGVKIYEKEDVEEDESQNALKADVYRGKPKKRWNKESLAIVEDAADGDDMNPGVFETVRNSKGEQFEEKQKWTEKERELRKREMEKAKTGEAYPNMAGVKEEVIPGTNYKAEKEERIAEEEKKKNDEIEARIERETEKSRLKEEKNRKKRELKEEEERRKKIEEEEIQEKIRLGKIKREKEEERKREEEQRKQEETQKRQDILNEKIRQGMESRRRRRDDTKPRQRKTERRTWTDEPADVNENDFIQRGEDNSLEAFFKEFNDWFKGVWDPFKNSNFAVWFCATLCQGKEIFTWILSNFFWLCLGIVWFIFTKAWQILVIIVILVLSLVLKVLTKIFSIFFKSCHFVTSPRFFTILDRRVDYKNCWFRWKKLVTPVPMDVPIISWTKDSARMKPKPLSEEAKQKQIQAMSCMDQLLYARAELYFTNAINLSRAKSGQLFAGRAKARYHQFNHVDALHDLAKVKKLNGCCSLEEMIIAAGCYIALGLVTLGRDILEEVDEADPDKVRCMEERIHYSHWLFIEQKMAEAKEGFNETEEWVLLLAGKTTIPHCGFRYNLQLAGMEAEKGRWIEGASILMGLGFRPSLFISDRRLDSGEENPKEKLPQVQFVVALCKYFQGELEEAAKIFTQCAVEPNKPGKCRWFAEKCDNILHRIDRGNHALWYKQGEAAQKLFEDAQDVDQQNKAVNKKCQVNIAMAHLLQKNWEIVVVLCDDILSSLEFDDILEILNTKKTILKCLRPLVMKGTALIELERYEEAIAVLIKAKEIEDSKEVKKLLNNARLLLKIQQGAEKTHYEVLGVDKNVNEVELKTMWKKLAKENHPDRFANATDEVKAEKEEEMKNINLANDILSDPEKRKRYDAEISMKEMYARDAERETSKSRDSSEQPEETDHGKEFEEYIKSEWDKHWTNKMTKLKKPRQPTNAEKDEFINSFLRNNRDHIRERYGFDIAPGSFGSHNKRQERRRKKRK